MCSSVLLLARTVFSSLCTCWLTRTVACQSLPRTMSCFLINCFAIPRNAYLQYCTFQHFNDIHINTHIYSVTPVTAQDYNPVYTLVCIHTVFSCQVCFKKNKRLAFYQDNSSTWNVMVHGFSNSVLMSEGGNVYHLVRVAIEVDKWTDPVPSLGQSRWPTSQVVYQSATQTPNLDNTWRPSENSTYPKLRSSTRHKPNECHQSPSSTRFGCRCS